MNGSVMPLAGIARRLTAMLIQLCTPNMIVSPAAAERLNGSQLRLASQSPRMTMKPKNAISAEAGDHAELLAGDGEHEIGVRVGQDALVDALAGPAAEPAARQDRLAARCRPERCR